MSSRFATTGLVWDNAGATQRYNPAGQPVAGQSALVATQSTWNNQRADCTLGQDDINGIRALYP